MTAMPAIQSTDVFREKHEIMRLKYELNLEAGRRNDLEKEIAELYQQMDQMKSFEHVSILEAQVRDLSGRMDDKDEVEKNLRTQLFEQDTILERIREETSQLNESKNTEDQVR